MSSIFLCSTIYDAFDLHTKGWKPIDNNLDFDLRPHSRFIVNLDKTLSQTLLVMLAFEDISTTVLVIDLHQC